jgi:hypothetical protein
MCSRMNDARADVPPLLAAEPASASLLLLGIHLDSCSDMLEQLPRIEIRGHVGAVHSAPIQVLLVLTRVNTRITSRAERPAGSPGSPESRSRVRAIQSLPRSLPGSRIPESLSHHSIIKIGSSKKGRSLWPRSASTLRPIQKAEVSNPDLSSGSQSL